MRHTIVYLVVAVTEWRGERETVADDDDPPALSVTLGSGIRSVIIFLDEVAFFWDIEAMIINSLFKEITNAPTLLP